MPSPATIHATHAPRRLLLLYGTTEGQTHKVAAHMARLAERQGYTVQLTNRPDTVLLATYDAVLIGASVHQGQHQSGITAFVREHSEALSALPSAFFSLSLSAAVPHPLQQEEAQGYIGALLHESGWRPWRTLAVAGALRQAGYDYYKRLVLTLLSTQLGESVATDKDVEFTDWAAVDAFLEDFLEVAFAPPAAVSYA
jgi:menaquinone-dependent protoporphyrinogen oxidase